MLVGFLAELGGGHVLVEQIGVVLHGVQDVGAGLQDLVLDLDEVDRLFGDVCGVGSHGCDGVPAEQGFVGSQNVVAGRARRHRGVLLAGDGQIGARHNTANAGQRFGGRGVDGLNSRVGVGATQNFCVEHPAHFKVRAVFGPPGYLVGAVVANRPRADDIIVGV